jgi:hypothetical protein
MDRHHLLRRFRGYDFCILAGLLNLHPIYHPPCLAKPASDSEIGGTFFLMITYHPPKSQWWGHQVSRLSAVQVVERGLRFLKEKAKIKSLLSADLMVLWNSADSPALSHSMEKLIRTLGSPSHMNDLPGLRGSISRQYRWTISKEHLITVAEWFDEVRPAMDSTEVVGHCIAMWDFEWLTDSNSLPPTKKIENMFGIQLGRPHRISTVFGFRTVADYISLKAFLTEISLVKLSDNHIRPKGSIP